MTLNFIAFKVVTLEYEAYDEMAKKEMANICFEIRQRWPEIKHIAMYHRLGLVPVKEASVVIAISSPHRKASLEALPFALDELKKSVPVWKKEYYKVDAGEDSSSQWKENPECTWSKKHQLDHQIL
jgi:molybdopterin synthase catalytic subunit